MALLTYTTYDSIRAVLGVASTELTDVVLGLPVFDLQFQLALEDLDSGNGVGTTQYTTIAAILPASRTKNQQRFFDLVGMYCSYSIAHKLLDNLKMYAPLTIQEGKASVTRMDAADSAVRRGVETGLLTVKSLLKTLLVTLVPSAQVTLSPPRVHAASVTTAIDPVTGV